MATNDQVRHLYFLTISANNCLYFIIFRKQQFLMIFQGLLGGVSMVGSVAAVTMMPVADALTIIFTSPLVTIILAVIFIGT